MFNPHEEEEEARDIQELMQRYQNLILGGPMPTSKRMTLKDN